MCNLKPRAKITHFIYKTQMNRMTKMTLIWFYGIELW